MIWNIIITIGILFLLIILGVAITSYCKKRYSSTSKRRHNYEVNRVDEEKIEIRPITGETKITDETKDTHEDLRAVQVIATEVDPIEAVTINEELTNSVVTTKEEIDQMKAKAFYDGFNAGKALALKELEDFANKQR